MLGFEEIYGSLIAKAKEFLKIASLLQSQNEEIEQLKKEKSLHFYGGLIYRIEKLSETSWKLYVKKKEEKEKT